MELEDAPLVYGLELSSRCLCSQAGETNLTRFLVATQSLRQENQIHLLEFDDESNHLEKYVFPHTPGEVWHLSTSFTDPALFTTCYHTYRDSQPSSACRIWRLPGLDAADTGPIADLAELDHGAVSHALWKPVDNDAEIATVGDKALKLWDLSDGEPRLSSAFAVPEKRHAPANGKWNPHHGAKQFAVAVGQRVLGWDLRADCPAFAIDHAHQPLTRDVDFNPNKQYYMLSCGDDCLVKFWDIRSLAAPVTRIDQHRHWVWSARFNPFHDQLILSCASDTKVVLYDKSSISSEPYGHFVDEDDDDQEEEGGREKAEDGLIAVYEEHEESVYAVEWSAAEPWSFASLSYDGRVVVNKVPKKVKFDILL